MKLAFQFGRPVNQIKKEITSKEFLKWRVFFEVEKEEYNDFDYYMTRICQLIRIEQVKKGTNVSPNDFLPPHKKQAKRRNKKEMSREEYLAHSKTAWGIAVGKKLK